MTGFLLTPCSIVLTCSAFVLPFFFVFLRAFDIVVLGYWENKGKGLCFMVNDKVLVAMFGHGKNSHFEEIF